MSLGSEKAFSSWMKIKYVHMHGNVLAINNYKYTNTLYSYSINTFTCFMPLIYKTELHLALIT